jgi:hypothetical protein
MKPRKTSKLQSQKSQAAVELPEVSSYLQNKGSNSPITISQDCVLMQVSLNVKMVGRIKKRSIRVKRNNVSKSIKCCSYGCPYFKTVVIKHAKQ